MPKADTGRRIRSRMAVFWTAVALLALHGGLSFWAFVQAPFYDDKVFQERFEAYRARWAAARSEGRKAIVVVGSSRVEWGLRARIAEQALAADLEPAPLVHNLGFAGAGPLLDWAVVRRLLASPAPPNFLVLEINPMFCRTKHGAPYETPRLVREKLFPVERLQLDRLGWKRWDPSKWSFDDLAPVWYRSRADLLEPLRPKSLVARKPVPPQKPVDAWGDSTALGAPVPADKTQDFTRLAHDDYFEALQNLNFDPTALAAMDDIVQMCEARRVPVALLIMPESDHFRSWYSAKAQAAIAEALDHLRDRRTVACFDARAWLPDLSYYFDSHHLLDDGAGVFSRRFAGECILPWLRGATAPAGTRPFQTTSFPKSKEP